MRGFIIIYQLGPLIITYCVVNYYSLLPPITSHALRNTKTCYLFQNPKVLVIKVGYMFLARFQSLVAASYRFRSCGGTRCVAFLDDSVYMSNYVCNPLFIACVLQYFIIPVILLNQASIKCLIRVRSFEASFLEEAQV